METIKPLREKQFFRPEDFEQETRQVEKEPEIKSIDEMDKSDVDSYINAINGIKGMF